jgi:hypothetical protein
MIHTLYNDALLNSSHFTLKMEAVWPSETSVSPNIITRCHSSENNDTMVEGSHVYDEETVRNDLEAEWDLKLL